MSPINFECFLCSLPGFEYSAASLMRPKGGAIQYTGERWHLDPDPLPGIARSRTPKDLTRHVLEMVFEFGNGQGAQLLGRSLSVGDVICVWRNPYGQRCYYAIERDNFRLVDSAPFEALTRAVNLLVSRAAAISTEAAMAG